MQHFSPKFTLMWTVHQSRLVLWLWFLYAQPLEMIMVLTALICVPLTGFYHRQSFRILHRNRHEASIFSTFTPSFTFHRSPLSNAFYTHANIVWELVYRSRTVGRAGSWSTIGLSKLPAVITSLDSTLYHCHQQGYSPKYRWIVFLLYIFSGLFSSKYSIFPLKILNNHN